MSFPGAAGAFVHGLYFFPHFCCSCTQPLTHTSIHVGVLGATQTVAASRRGAGSVVAGARWAASAGRTAHVVNGGVHRSNTTRHRRLEVASFRAKPGASKLSCTPCAQRHKHPHTLRHGHPHLCRAYRVQGKGAVTGPEGAQEGILVRLLVAVSKATLAPCSCWYYWCLRLCMHHTHQQRTECAA